MKNWFAFLFIFIFAACDNNRPQRKIMSINACADQLLLSLADKDQIGSLTQYSKDAVTSDFYELAKTFPTNHQSAEEIILEQPKILFASNFDEGLKIDIANKIGAKIYRFGVPNNILEAKELVVRAGIATGQTKRAIALNSEINIAARPNHTKKIRALIYFQNGNSVGKNTLLDELMDNAGLYNVAPEFGVKNWGQIDIERVIKNPPNVIIIAAPINNGAMSERLLRHKALKDPALNIKFASFPNQYAYCGGAVIPKLAARLKQIRNEYE